MASSKPSYEEQYAKFRDQTPDDDPILKPLLLAKGKTQEQLDEEERQAVKCLCLIVVVFLLFAFGSILGAALYGVITYQPYLIWGKQQHDAEL
mmetsp:Transcript_13447/g.22144  ORF Transcript_13447/g.22144 Transcript_13447/m.22144 type:complete len:93 (+) Transcript_13447:60-338(+)